MNPERMRKGRARAREIIQHWRKRDRMPEGYRELRWPDRDFWLWQEGLLTRTRCTCSGACCGNPRKWFGETTMAEKKAEITAREQLAEYV